MSTIALRIGVLFLSCALSACAGGTHALPATQATGGGATTGATTARFTITVPSSAGTAAARAPQFISSSTQSVIITLTQVNGIPYTGSPASIATNLTSSNAACSGTPLTCFVAAPAVAGNDTFTIATFDTQQTSLFPSTPLGSLLSQSTLAVSLIAGQSNTVTTPLVLGGVAASFRATPSGPAAQPTGVIPATNYLRGNASGLRLWGPQAQTLAISPLDASGNVIVGSGAPVVRVSSPSATLTVSGPSSNVFTIQATVNGSPAVVTPGIVNLALTAVAASAAGAASANVSIPVTIAHSIVYLSDGQPSGHVFAFLDGNVTASASLTITNGAGAPANVAVDANGTIYVANNSSNTVTEYAPGRTSPSLTIATGASPIGVAVDSHGTLYVANLSDNTVTEYAAGSTSANLTITGLNSPTGLAVDTNGTLYVASQGAGTIITFAAGSTSPSGSITNGVVGPHGVAVDASGALYVANLAGHNLTTYLAGNPAVNATIGGFTIIGSVAVDVSGTMFVTDLIANTVSEFPASTTAGTASSATTTLTAPGAFSVAVVPGALLP